MRLWGSAAPLAGWSASLAAALGDLGGAALRFHDRGGGIHLAGHQGKQQFPPAEAGTRGPQRVEVAGGLEEAALLEVGLFEGLLGERQVEPLVALRRRSPDRYRVRSFVPNSQPATRALCSQMGTCTSWARVNGDVAGLPGDARIVAQPLPGGGKRLEPVDLLGEEPAGEPSGAPHEDPDAAVPAEKYPAAGPHAERTGALRAGQRVEHLLLGRRRRCAGRPACVADAASCLAARGRSRLRFDPQKGQTARSA